VYGAGREFRVAPECERPINAYAWSKLLFDQHARRFISGSRSQVVGLRYFNVYGPGEAHKGAMASVIWHFHNQLRQGDEVHLFDGSHGYGPGEQLRDFIYVDDVASANLWFLEHGGTRGIFNLGTGEARTFNDVARAVIDWHGRGRIRYVPFPPGLEASYQSFTQADLTTLRLAGYQDAFTGLEEGVRSYLDILKSQGL
jgi:ADP-L-glycero-D-manno-heptose 6-epimerase